MEHHFEAVHLYLWRNPWDQWWSYKVSPYFDTANLMILNARQLPPVFQGVCDHLGFREYHGETIDQEIAHFDARRLDTTQSYFLFYALWYHAIYQGLRIADVTLSIDGLSLSPDYRARTLTQLEGLGLEGLDFSDCRVHRGWFSKSDIDFFVQIEHTVRALFGRYGYDQEPAFRIASLQEEWCNTGASNRGAGDVDPELQEDLERMRLLVRREESEQARLRKEIVTLRQDLPRLHKADAELRSIYDSVLWKLTTPLREAYWKVRSVYRSRRNFSLAAGHPSLLLTEAAFSHCPVCRAVSPSSYDNQEWMVSGQRYRLLKCLACGSAFTSPLPSETVLENLYRTSFDYRWYQDHYDAKLQDCRMRIQEYGSLLGKRVLDFGGGVGYFSKAASEVGLESITYDPYVDSDIPGKNNWDSVIMLHVLEHSNDLDRTISQIKNFLVPGGRLIVVVPNFASLGYQMLGMRWVWAQPPLVHVFHFTASGLEALLARHGFIDFETSFHERWDANLYCDLKHVERFRSRDALWGLRPFNRFPFYRRWVARRNAKLRFAGLDVALHEYDARRDIYSELKITAVLGK